MKVLFLNAYDDPAVSRGGAEVTLRLLTQRLAGLGVRPVILATEPGKGLQRTENEGVRIWRAGLRNLYWPGSGAERTRAVRMLWHILDSYNPAMQPAFRHVLEIERPDIVSIHNLPGWSAAAWRTVADMGIPSVQVLHDAYAICLRSSMFKRGQNCSKQCAGCRTLRLPHRLLSNRVSAVVGVSRFVLERHLDLGYFRDVPIRQVIQNARDPGELGLNTSPPLTRDNGAVRVGFIGRLDPNKGVELLLEAFSQLPVSQAQLWIAGSGTPSYEAGLRARYDSHNVRFLGRVSPRSFFPQVDFVVVPSLWHDTFPGVVFEALAFGKPVLASRRGGIPELVRDGENGVLFEPDHPDDLDVGLRRLISDAAARVRMGAVARESAAPYLDSESWASRYAALYAEVLGDRFPIGLARTAGRNGARPTNPEDPS